MTGTGKIIGLLGLFGPVEHGDGQRRRQWLSGVEFGQGLRHRPAPPPGAYENMMTALSFPSVSHGRRG